MTQIDFYHLRSTPLERALPKLLEKAYQAGFRVHVLLESIEQRDFMNQALWTYTPLSFLPHGSDTEPHPERQPIFLSILPQPKNSPDMLCSVSGAVPETPEDYRRILDVFDGNNDASVAAARTRWAEYKAQGHALSYLKQNDQGAWEKAA